MEEEYYEQMVLRWIGSGTTRHLLRRKRPKLADWKKFDAALRRLIKAGAVLETQQRKVVGSSGYPATLYVPRHAR